MSRRTQMQYMLSRPSTLPKLTKRQVLEKLQREVKRRMIADGVIEDPATSEPNIEWHFHTLDGRGGVVRSSARTRSEARSKIKTLLGLPQSARLPVGIEIIKVIPNATARPFTLPNAGIAA